jgi:hypothetical protein
VAYERVQPTYLLKHIFWLGGAQLLADFCFSQGAGILAKREECVYAGNFRRLSTGVETTDDTFAIK